MKRKCATCISPVRGGEKTVSPPLVRFQDAAMRVGDRRILAGTNW